MFLLCVSAWCPTFYNETPGFGRALLAARSAAAAWLGSTETLTARDDCREFDGGRGPANGGYIGRGRGLLHGDVNHCIRGMKSAFWLDGDLSKGSKGCTLSLLQTKNLSWHSWLPKLTALDSSTLQQPYKLQSSEQKKAQISALNNVVGGGVDVSRHNTNCGCNSLIIVPCEQILVTPHKENDNWEHVCLVSSKVSTHTSVNFYLD